MRVILCIEDDPIELRIRSAILTRERYVVMEAADRASAIAAIRQHTFDLIIADYHLAGEEKGATIGEIRSMCPHVPLILISGVEIPEETVESLHAMFHLKVSGVETLLAKVRQQLGLASAA